MPRQNRSKAQTVPLEESESGSVANRGDFKISLYAPKLGGRVFRVKGVYDCREAKLDKSPEIKPPRLDVQVGKHQVKRLESGKRVHHAAEGTEEAGFENLEEGRDSDIEKHMAFDEFPGRVQLDVGSRDCCRISRANPQSTRRPVQHNPRP